MTPPTVPARSSAPPRVRLARVRLCGPGAALWAAPALHQSPQTGDLALYLPVGAQPGEAFGLRRWSGQDWEPAFETLEVRIERRDLLGAPLPPGGQFHLAAVHDPRGPVVAEVLQLPGLKNDPESRRLMSERITPDRVRAWLDELLDGDREVARALGEPEEPPLDPESRRWMEDLARRELAEADGFGELVPGWSLWTLEAGQTLQGSAEFLRDLFVPREDPARRVTAEDYEAQRLWRLLSTEAAEDFGDPGAAETPPPASS